MFNNQLSAKELYSTNPAQFLQRSGFRSDQEDSAFNSSQTLSQSNSQINSQMENSQSSSFDMFSQMMMSQGVSQQTESANNPQKFYMKYMSKAPLFNKESDRNIQPRKRSFQERLENNKQKAKERDDRDLINTFVTLVKDCTEEVRSAATDIRKNVDKNISDTASQFGDLIQKINEDLKSYHVKLLGAMKITEDQQATLTDLLQNIAAKDAKIEVLEMQLETAKKERDERVVHSLMEVYTEQQKINREHIDKMQEEQQAFCKTQIQQLQQDQHQRSLHNEAGSSEVIDKRVRGLQSGQRLMAAPIMDGDNRPRSWQAVAQYEQSGCQIQSGSRHQESMINQIHPSYHLIGGATRQMVEPTLNHGSNVRLPPWPAQPSLQNRESYPQCGLPYTYNQPAVTQPRLPISNQGGGNLGPDGRPSGFHFQQQHEAVPHLMSPTSSATTSGRWNANKVRPSPIAAVAPQVMKPQEAVLPTQEQQTNQGNEAPVLQAPTRKKKVRKPYQVAVKSKRQSARVKAKKPNPDTANQMKKKPETQPRIKTRNSQTVSEVNTTKPLQDPEACHWLKEEDVYEFIEPPQKTLPVVRKRKAPKEKNPQERQNSRSQRKASTKVSQNDNIYSQKRVTSAKSLSASSIKAPKEKLVKSRQNQTNKKSKEMQCKSSSVAEIQSTWAEDLRQGLVSRDESEMEVVTIHQPASKPVRRKQVQRKNKQASKQTIKGVTSMNPAKQPSAVSLDTMPSYSDHEDSSEDMIFSLKLPDSPWFQKSSSKQQSHRDVFEEQVVPTRGSDICSTPYIQIIHDDESSDETVVTRKPLSMSFGSKVSRQQEKKRCLSNSSSAAMAEISNALRLQQSKIRKIKTY
ncbi:uncharacterized protein LOC117307297 [Asterias rubens]|uniref:uncharacterized protein LOC117307297 n=1 Tax=Asterias rubens TaxID=7604 RepID=UPI001455AB2A|nr:uncharacterized protein LOC117307297 [Asterias rubens]